MWTSKNTLELSFAVVNFTTGEIVWKAGGFSPKRKNRVEWALSTKCFLISDLENVF